MGKLDSYNKHWVGIPYALSVLVTGDSFLILYHIIRHSRESISSRPVLLSKRKLAKLIGRSRNVVDKNIKTLEDLNLVNVTGEIGSLSSFVINWTEIEFINALTSKITDDGWIYLRTLCLKKNSITPLSSLSQDICLGIEQKYFIESGSISEPGGSKIEPGGLKNEPLDTEVAQKMSHPIDDDAPSNEHFAETAKVNTEVALKLSHFEAGGGSKIEPLHIKSGSKNEPGGSISEHRYKYINNNINDNEQSSFNIKGEKENKIQDWFNSRDLSFPALSSDEFNSIFELPDFNDDDASKAIRLVWDSLNYDSTSQNNYIPADMFKDVLFRAWNQLKEDSKDFSLSEQDMKNIFAFDLIEQDGEFFCEIIPSNIKNISSTGQESSRSQKKGQNESRISRNIFIECIREIGEKDDKLLTDAEFAIQLMIDYIQDTSKGHSAIISKLMYENLLQDFSKQSNLPIEDLRELWKDLPQKGKVTLSPTQLSVQKIMDYNARFNRESEVEKLYKAKMAETQK